MSKTQETVLEINLNALQNNYEVIKSQVDNEVKMMAVVKAFGYGSDFAVVAKKLETLKVDYFAVAYIQEGVILREAGITTPILVLHPQSANFNVLIENCLEPGIYSPFVLKEFIKIATEKNLKSYPIHLKFNTGMNRLGFSPNQFDEVFEEIENTSSIKIAAVYSHLAASEDWKERAFTLSQIESFRQIAIKVLEKIDYVPLFHICNTSGIFNYPEASFSMVRAGIGLYGYGNDPEINKKLKPVGTLKTIISQLQYLEIGDSVGYNRAFKAKKKMISATLPIGYADGIGRQYGNKKAGVFVHGKFAPIIGNVCMDMLMIDVTDIPCEDGDEVIIFGNIQEATTLAEIGNTISYEVITSVSQRVKRVIISD